MAVQVSDKQPLEVKVTVGNAEKGRYEVNFIGADKTTVQQRTGRSDDDISDVHSFSRDSLVSGAMVEWEIWVSSPADAKKTAFTASVTLSQGGRTIEEFAYADEPSPIWSYVTLEVK